MKKLLNTLYLTQEDFYVTKEGDNIVIKQEGRFLNGFRFGLLTVLSVFLIWVCHLLWLNYVRKIRLIYHFTHHKGVFVVAILVQPMGMCCCVESIIAYLIVRNL